MRQHNLHVLLAVAGIAGIAGIFLPFTWDISPMVVMGEKQMWMLGFPFFLSVAVAAASTQWIISGSFSRLESAIAYVVSGSTTCLTLAFIARFLFDENGGQLKLIEWVAVITAVGVLTLGAYLVIRVWRTVNLIGFRPLMALQVAYLGNAAFCLITFFDWPGWQAGAYLALTAAIAYLLQIILVYVQSRAASIPRSMCRR